MERVSLCSRSCWSAACCCSYATERAKRSSSGRWDADLDKFMLKADAEVSIQFVVLKVKTSWRDHKVDTRIKPVSEEAAAFFQTSSRRCWSSACSVVNSVCLCSSSTRFTAVCAPSGRCLRSGRASVCLCAVCWRVEESSRWRKLKRLDSLRYERLTCHLQPPWHHCVTVRSSSSVCALRLSV